MASKRSSDGRAAEGFWSGTGTSNPCSLHRAGADDRRLHDHLYRSGRHLRGSIHPEGVRFFHRDHGMDSEFVPVGLRSFSDTWRVVGRSYWSARALTLIVSWWSLFTCATVLAWSAGSMALIRFLFGMGEAGAFPIATRSLSRWMLPTERGLAQGATHAGSRLGERLRRCWWCSSSCIMDGALPLSAAVFWE